MNCWAYIGATAFFVINWEGSSLTGGELEGGVKGEMGFNMDFVVDKFENKKFSAETELVRVDECTSPIYIYGVVTIQVRTMCPHTRLDAGTHRPPPTESSMIKNNH